MHVSVEINPKSYNYYFGPVFLQFDSLQQSLVDDFKIYKATGKLPDYFGRDTEYVRPDEIQGSGLMHIHLAIGDQKFGPLPKHADPANGKSIQWHRTSDAALLYSQNLFDENSYSLIAIFHPGAHSKAQNEDRMKILATYSREFRETFPD